MNPTGAEVIGEGQGGRGEGMGGGEHQTEGEDEHRVCVREIVCIVCVFVAVCHNPAPDLRAKDQKKEINPPPLPSCAAGGREGGAGHRQSGN